MCSRRGRMKGRMRGRMRRRRRMMGNQPVDIQLQRRDRYEKPFDEKRVPSRLAAEYTNFGWVRARNKISEERDRNIMGIRLYPYQDKYITEAIRRKKRFGLSLRLRGLEYRYFWLVNRRDRCVSGGVFGGSLACLLLGLLFLIVAVAFAVVSFVPKAPGNPEECAGTTKLEETILDIRNSIDNGVFYGNRYFVLDSDIQKDKTAYNQKAKTVIVLNDDATIQMLDKNGQPNKVAKDSILSKVEREKSGIIVVACEKAPDYASSYSYRYYIYNDSTGALGFLVGVIPEASPSVWFGILSLFLAIVCFIICGCLAGLRKRARDYSLRLEQLKLEVRNHVSKMRQEDPSLMTKAQRHYASWQKLMVNSINMSGIAKNDNVERDDFEDDELDMFF